MKKLILLSPLGLLIIALVALGLVSEGEKEELTHAQVKIAPGLVATITSPATLPGGEWFSMAPHHGILRSPLRKNAFVRLHFVEAEYKAFALKMMERSYEEGLKGYPPIAPYRFGEWTVVDGHSLSKINTTWRFPIEVYEERTYAVREVTTGLLVVEMAGVWERWWQKAFLENTCI